MSRRQRDLALTPPLGWNSWNQVRCRAGVNGGTGLTEDVVKEAAHAMASNGMKEAGYQYVVVDDCYQGPRDPHTGRLTANPDTFPGGMKALGEYIHAKGLKFGIYGVPGSTTCANHWDGYPVTDSGSLGREQLDADTWAEWGVDYLKYDWCRADETDQLEKVPTFNAMRDALENTGRDIVYAISEYGVDEPWTWGPDTANLWRTTHDIRPTWGSVVSIINDQVDLWEHARPGAWNDPDMLQVGNGAFADDSDANRAHIGMWAMLAAPMFIGTSIPDLKPQILEALINPDVLSINQDPLGRQARRLSSVGGAQVWARPLEGDRIAVALYNSRARGRARTIATSVAAVGGSGSYTVRSVWDQQDLGSTSGDLTASVPARGTVLYVLAPTPRA